MDYKGKLLQWCAKNNAVCTFQTVYISGPPHNLTYMYSVTVNGVTIEGENPMGKRKGAEREAARVYIEQKGLFDAAPAPFHVDKKTCYYIDLENCADIDLSSLPYYVAIASEAAPRSVTSRATYLTGCTRSDAADVALIVQLTGDILSKQYKRYAVVSRDKLLLTAVEVLMDRFEVDIVAIYP